jgi:hypothetical protein
MGLFVMLLMPALVVCVAGQVGSGMAACARSKHLCKPLRPAALAARDIDDFYSF